MHNPVSRALGDNKFEVEHNGAATRHNNMGLLQATVDIDQDAYRKALTWWVGGVKSA